MSQFRYLKYIPAIIWMLVIFYFSSRSTAGFVEGTIERFIFFKTLHLIEFFILSILVFYGIRKYQPSILISYLYAISDEFHQSFVPGRTPKFTDTLVDFLGICLGLLVLKYIRKYLSKFVLF